MQRVRRVQGIQDCVQPVFLISCEHEEAKDAHISLVEQVFVGARLALGILPAGQRPLSTLGSHSLWLFPWPRRTSVVAVRPIYIPPAQSWDARMGRYYTETLGRIYLVALRLGLVAQLAADATSDASDLAPFRSDETGLGIAPLIVPEWETHFLAAHIVPQLPWGRPWCSCGPLRLLS